jgi:hypothetical protein
LIDERQRLLFWQNTLNTAGVLFGEYGQFLHPVERPLLCRGGVESGMIVPPLPKNENRHKTQELSTKNGLLGATFTKL